MARAVGLTLTAILSLVGTGAAAVVVDLKNSVHHSNAMSLVQGVPTKAPDPSDPFAGRALNIILIGTDYRGDAKNVALAGEEDGMRADTTMMIHVSANRKWIEVFSIPRDLLVKIPSCKLPSGATTRTQYNAMFNSAFSLGGGSEEDMDYAAACTITAASELTGIVPTDMIVVKMDGVVNVVKELGNVTMCLPEAMKESTRYGNLDLPAGKVSLDGRTSLEFLRARHGKGFGLEEGSDLTRIQRQQAFLNAFQHQIQTSGLFSNPTKMYGVSKAVLGSLLVSPAFTATSIPGLAWSLRNLDSTHLVFSELHTGQAPSDRNRLVLARGALGAENEAMFRRFVDDTPPAQVQHSRTPSGTRSSGVNTPAGTPAGPSPAQGGTGQGSSGSRGTGGASSTPTATATLPVGVCPS